MPVPAAGCVQVAAILVVEDDVFIREIAEMMIRDWGHHILSACGVSEALLLMHSLQPIDALFTAKSWRLIRTGPCHLVFW